MGSNVYNDPPRYYKGNSVCAGGLFANFMLAVGGIYYLKWRNAKKDKEHGQAGEVSGVVTADEGGKDHKDWRFVM